MDQRRPSQVPPEVRRGPQELAPGPWARLARTQPWSVACSSERYLSPLMDFLGRQEILREPTVRQQWDVSSLEFLMAIGDSRSHVEALWLYMTGDVVAAKCTGCRDNRGPFPLCVVNRSEYARADCANCWWSGGDHCSFRLPANAYQSNEPPNRDPEGLTPADRRVLARLLEPTREALAAVEDLRANSHYRRREMATALDRLEEAFAGLENAGKQL